MPLTQKKSPTLFQMIIVAVLFGVFAGLVTELFYQTYITPPLVSSGDVIIQKQVSSPLFNLDSVEDILGKENFLVSAFRAKQDGEFYYDNERIGSGLTLTADGWILLKTIDNVEPQKIVVSPNLVLGIDRLILDPISNVYLAKVDGQQLRSAQLSNDRLPSIGELAVVFTPNGGLIFSSIRNDVAYDNSHESIIRDTLEYQSYVQLDRSLSSNLSGSPVLNASGEVIGIYDTEDKMIPVFHFYNQIRDIVREQEVSLPQVSIKYIDLAYTISSSQEYQKGAKIIEAPKGSALMKDDIVVTVDGEDLSKKVSLSDKILEFRTGESITLKVIRKKESIDIKIDL